MKIPIDIKSGEIKTSENQQKIIVGIDLGTTNSLIAYIKEGEAIAISGRDSNQTIVPSVIFFDEENKPIVGEEALKRITQAPERTIYSVKRLMGKSWSDLDLAQVKTQYRLIPSDNEDTLVRIEVGGLFYTPVELSALILKELKLRAEHALQQEISAAVITVPAYFNDAQRQATRDAGKLAGLDVLRIVNEPTAASLGYGVGLSRDSSQTIAVYDLGGGTFDISILNLNDGIFEVLSTHGNTLLGGDDFDTAIARLWIEKYNLDEDESLLRVFAEEAKKTLSSTPHFMGKFKSQTLELSTDEFENIIKGFVEQTLEACRNALKDAGLKTSDIDTLVLVGGSTRVPLVRNSVESFFNREAVAGVDPDEVVALGAAIQADILAGNRKDLLLLDITPLSLGIETVGGLMDVIISRNSKVPMRAAKNYTTSVDGQRNLKISVFQGERELVANNRKLGEFILKDLPPMPAGIPKIEIAFLLDADGILTVKAKELRSGQNTQIEIKSAYGISEEEMALMLLESIRNADSDFKKKTLVEAVNEANNILLASEKFLKFHSALFSVQELKELVLYIDNLKNSTQGEDANKIRVAIDELNTFSRPLAERAMDATVSNAMKGNKIG